MNRVEELARGWQRWRAISDKITSNRHYRYGDPAGQLLGKLAKFAMAEMGHYNGLYWRKMTGHDATLQRRLLHWRTAGKGRRQGPPDRRTA